MYAAPFYQSFSASFFGTLQKQKRGALRHAKSPELWIEMKICHKHIQKLFSLELIPQDDIKHTWSLVHNAPNLTIHNVHMCTCPVYTLAHWPNKCTLLTAQPLQRQISNNFLTLDQCQGSTPTKQPYIGLFFLVWYSLFWSEHNYLSIFLAHNLKSLPAGYSLLVYPKLSVLFKWKGLSEMKYYWSQSYLFDN